MTDSQKKCIKCGAEILASDEFCMYCGSKQAETNPALPIHQQKSHSSKKLVILLVIALVIVSAGLGFVLLNGSQLFRGQDVDSPSMEAEEREEKDAADASATEAPWAEAGEPTQDSVYDEPGSVYWLNDQPAYDETLQQLAAMYSAETGNSVTVVTASYGTYEQVLSSELKSANAPTLFSVGDRSTAKKWEDYCLDLGRAPVAKEMLDDSFGIYDSTYKLNAIGFNYECFGIIVNKKLLGRAGYPRDYITDYATLKEVAEDVHSRAAELGFDAFAANGLNPSCSWRYTGHLVNLVYYWEAVGDPQMWFSCPPFIWGFHMDNYRQLYDLIVNNSSADRVSLAKGNFDPLREFSDEEALFYLGGNWDWDYLQSMGLKAKDLVMIPYYSGVRGEENVGLSADAYSYWSVNANASEADRQATLEFLHWMVTDPEASRIAVAGFGAMPFRNVAAPSNPFLAQAAAYIEQGRESMWWAMIYQPDVDKYRAGMVKALTEYNVNPTDENWNEVVGAVVGGWENQ